MTIYAKLADKDGNISCVAIPAFGKEDPEVLLDLFAKKEGLTVIFKKVEA